MEFARKAPELAVLGVLTACSPQPEKAPAASNAKAIAAPQSATSFKPLTVENLCVLQFNSEEVARRSVGLSVVMTGSIRPDEEGVARLMGTCDYAGPDSPLVGRAGGRKVGWACDMKAYGLDSGFHSRGLNDQTRVPAYDSVQLPYLLGVDIRGYTSAEGWFGSPREPYLDGDKELVIDDVSIDESGQLRFACSRDISTSEFVDAKGCQVSWRSTRRPEKIFLHGTCGEVVTVPGLFVQAAP
jgi:hypothetical protein